MMQLLGWSMIAIALGMLVATVIIRRRARREPGYQDGISAAVITGLMATLALVGGLTVLHVVSLILPIVVVAVCVTMIAPLVWRRARRGLYYRGHYEE